MTRIRIKEERIVTVSIDDLPHQLADRSLDPYAVLRAKTQHLADLLDCSEEDAERILLDRLGQ